MLTALITLKAKDESHMLYFERVQENGVNHHYSIWINRNNSEIVNPTLYPIFNKISKNETVVLDYVEYKVTEVSQLIAQY
ncbi:hypothetical protein I2F27_10735 [Acinetobacter sp. B5B]|uniref:hypothetical protein n=1 Tax=Acinetobacter baretiae TaxID=2605383 RepID=UPI0018C331E1|nr:hypothetical protein [Acinetobacter baretiae]MBF7683792.1 hypothetical protein [Acinetobacter baretiae]MBF7686401.1 hypothetical protein [Acinetobacter baretiae]